MEKNYIKITLTYTHAEAADILVALLSAEGYIGFEEQQEDNHVIAYIDSEIFDEESLQEIANTHKVSYTKIQIPHENWNQRWESDFSPVIVENFCAIRAHFHPEMDHVKHDIIITPKMSFGTGHHATTYMMIQCIGSLYVKNKSVFDFGTGTGILAILAEKEEARGILAIDNDAWSVENAKENIQMNDCQHIILQLSDQPPTSKNFDVILANINKHIILETLPMLAGLLNPGGILCCSGFYNVDVQDVIKSATNHNLQVKNQYEKDNWSCLVFEQYGGL